MKICFMGTPDFALLALQALLDNNYNVTAVYTRLPKPKGRGKKMFFSPVYDFAKENNIPIFTPKTLKNKESQDEFIAQNFDLCIVASYGLILPKEVLDSPKYGCINIHASLLPKLRGASPIQQAIIEAPSLDHKTGITIMQMDTGLDSGDILLQESLPITNSTTFSILYAELGKLGAKLIIQALQKLKDNTLYPKKQDENEVTFTKILTKADGQIDFNVSALLIERKIRALNPFPSTYFFYKNEPIKIIQATAIENDHAYQNGEIISLFPLQIACDRSILEISLLQRQGKRTLPAKDFIQGFKFSLGDLIHSNS